MKIVILTVVFQTEHIGGTEIASYNIAKHLAKRGHEVHVIASGSRGLPKEAVEDNFYVHRVSYPKIRSLGILYFWLKTPFYIKKVNPDIIQCESTQMGLPAFLYKKFFKTPYIVWGQGSDIYLNWKFKKLIHKLVFDNADKVIGMSGDMKKKIQENYKKDVLVLPSGINLENFEGLSKETARSKLKIDLNEKIIIFVGLLHHDKGLKYLIRAFKTIKDKMPETRLILVGDGKDRQKLKRLVKKNNLEKQVNFTGDILNNKIPEYMIASDIFVLPSLSEGLGIVNLEAMASGLPIVATRVGGIPEIIEDGENGFLVEPKNSKQLAEKILCLLSNDELRKHIFLKNTEKAKSYSWDLVIEKLLKIYSFCLENRF